MVLFRRRSCLVVLTLSVFYVLSDTKPLSQLTFEKQPPIVEGKTGENVVLDCKVEGSPSPLLHWKRNGKIISQDLYEVDADIDYQLSTSYAEDDSAALRMAVGPDIGRKLKMSSTRARLYLDCLTAEDAGEYVCVASTPHQTIETTTILRVDESQTKQKCEKKSPNQGKAVRIYMWTVSRLEYEGGSVHLFCRATGSPYPHVTWLDPKDNVIKNSDKYQLMKNGDLVIRDVKWAENMGFYRCIAKNDDVIDEVTTFLYPIAS